MATPGTYTYAWAGPSNFASTLQSPTVLYSSPTAMQGIYTVTATNVSTHCTATATVTVTPICVASGTPTISGAITPTTVAANGVYFINAAASFGGGAIANRTFIIASGVLISVPLTARFTNCTFLGCPDSWEGIVVAPGATIALNNCRLINAKTALSLAENSYANVVNTTFDQNIRSIYINGTPDINSVFTGNTFGCTPNGLVGLGANTYPEVGILIENCQYMTIGSPSAANSVRNTFSRLCQGIRAVSSASNVTVLGCDFRDILASYNDPIGGGLANKGCGIIAEKNNMTVARSTTVIRPNCSFTNCSVGIQGNNAITLQVVNNSFVGGAASDIGIRAINTQRDLTISSNVMSGYTRGIFAFNTLANATLQNNTIAVAKTNGVGIWIDQVSPALPVSPATNIAAIYAIANNTINLSSRAVDGIAAMGVANSSLTNNTVNITPTAFSRSGINLTNCNNLKLECNAITNTTNNRAIGTPIGVRMTATTNTLLNCTHLNSTYTGIKIEGTCTGSYLKGTEFNNHTRGLWVFGGSTSVSNATLPDHLNYEGNKWLDNAVANYPVGSNFYGAYLGTNTAVWTTGVPPKFFYNPNNVDLAQLTAIRTSHPTGWFFASTPPSPDPTFTCPACTTTGGGTGSSTAPTDPIFSDTDMAIAQDSIDFGSHEDVAKWEAKKTLYAKITEYNGVLVEGSPLDVFRDSVAITPIADFVATENVEKQVLDIPAALKAQYTSYGIVADNYKLTLQYIDSLRQTTIDSTTLAGYDAQQAAILVQLEMTQAQLVTLQNQINTARDLKITTALELNDLLEAGEVYEYNKKAVADVYLHTIAKNNTNLDATQWATIAVIAAQCPYAGGKAVYEARAIYALISNEIYDDHSICAAVGIEARIAPPKSPKGGELAPSPSGRVGVGLYPNPTQGIVQLFVPATYQGASIAITNAVGQTMQTAAINGLVNTLNLGDLPEGIYFVTLRQAGQIVYQTKIVHLP